MNPFSPGSCFSCHRLSDFFSSRSETDTSSCRKPLCDISCPPWLGRAAAPHVRKSVFAARTFFPGPFFWDRGTLFLRPVFAFPSSNCRSFSVWIRVHSLCVLLIAFDVGFLPGPQGVNSFYHRTVCPLSPFSPRHGHV